MATLLQQCIKCKFVGPPEQFTGKHGRPTQHCGLCIRKKTALYAKRKVDDAFNQANVERARAYLKRKRETGGEEFKQRQAEYFRGRREHILATDGDAFKKSEQIRGHAYREIIKNDVGFKVKSYKHGAKRRKLVWDESMTEDVCRAMMTGPCHYCHHFEEGKLVGIDRMDGFKGYDVANCVGCCGSCNRMKKSLDARTFLHRCIHLASCLGHGTTFHPEAWPETPGSSYAYYQWRAQRKHTPFELAETQFEAMTSMPCTYCRRETTFKNGLDRLDVSGGYVADNVVPCCSECNYMRGTMTVDAFHQLVIAVAHHAPSIEIPEMSVCRRSIPRCGKIL